jgi:hypothetical protein
MELLWAWTSPTTTIQRAFMLRMFFQAARLMLGIGNAPMDNLSAL